MPLGVLQHLYFVSVFHPDVSRIKKQMLLGVLQRTPPWFVPGLILRIKNQMPLGALQPFADTYTNKDNASEASKILTEELIRELRNWGG